MKERRELKKATKQLRNFIIKKVATAIALIALMLVGCWMLNNEAQFNTQYGGQTLFGVIIPILYILVVSSLTVVDIMSALYKFKKYKEIMLKKINFSMMLIRGY